MKQIIIIGLSVAFLVGLVVYAAWRNTQKKGCGCSGCSDQKTNCGSNDCKPK